MVRPSYVLGGRAMEIVYSDADMHRYITTAVEVDPERPVLVDKYLDRADELDVDALAGGCAGRWGVRWRGGAWRTGHFCWYAVLPGAPPIQPPTPSCTPAPRLRPPPPLLQTRTATL